MELGRQRCQAIGVEVVGQVGELHRTRDRVLRDPLDERRVVLTVALGEGLDGRDDALIKATLAELVQRDAGSTRETVPQRPESNDPEQRTGSR